MAYTPSTPFNTLSGSLAENFHSGSIIPVVGIGPGFNIRVNPANLGTALNSTSTVDVNGANCITYQIATTTTGTFTFEGTADAVNWINVEVFNATDDIWVSGQNLTPTAGKIYHILCAGMRQVRLRVASALGATVSHDINITMGNQLIAAVDTGAAPHNFGYPLIHEDNEYTTQQTGVTFFTPTAGRKFVVTDLTITTGGTTSGIVTMWQGASADTTYTAGTDNAIFRGEFAPSANSKPGVVKSFNVPYVSTTADHQIKITTSAAMTVYVQINGYEII